MAFATTVKLVIATPLQALVHLDDESRFKAPGTSEGNWIWRKKNFDDKLQGV